MESNNFIGSKFGRLTVVEFDYKRNRNTWWKCKCDCGNTKSVYRGSLTNGDIQSCGCYRQEVLKRVKHGMSNTRLYSIWSAMIQRCTNPNNDRYNSYGGRGIKICDEWLTSSNFISWSLENGYDECLSLERINVNGNYEPSNCKFIPPINQYDNKQNSRIISYNGRTMTLSKWALELNINRETLRYRVDKWGVERAFESLPYAKELILYGVEWNK